VAVRRHSALLFIAAVGVTADTLAFRALGPAILLPRLVGIVVAADALPKGMALLKRHAFLRPVALYMVQLMLLAVVFGYLVPWESGWSDRKWNQQAEGRSVVSVLRQLADLSLMAYVAHYASDDRGRRAVIGGLVAGLAANTLVALIDLATGIRIAEVFFGGEMRFLGRQGGLNAEPRALGRIAAIGLLAGLAMPLRKIDRIRILLASMVSLALAASTSAILALGSAIAAYAGLGGLKGQVRRLLAVGAVMTVGAGIFAAVWEGGVNYEVSRRVERLAEASDAEPDEPWLVARLEVFDRAAMRFLLANPEYLWLGTGPDLISLPASPYVAGTARAIYGDRIDSVPHTWLISTLANGGIVGVLLMGTFIIGLLSATRNTPGVEPGWRGFALMLVVFSLIVMTPAFWLSVGLVVGRIDGAIRDGANPPSA